MSRRILICGVAHGLQTTDHHGKLGELLAERIHVSNCALIAEEATGLSTTVGQRMAFRMGIPWMNMDMDERERVLFGIHHELGHRPLEPITDEGGGYVEHYLPYADPVREIHWADKIRKQNVHNVIALCGVLHLSPFAERLGGRGWEVEQLDVSRLDWYVDAFGKGRVVTDEYGIRCYELRYPKQGHP